MDEIEYVLAETRHIMRLEQKRDVDWDLVSAKCLGLVDFINENGISDRVPNRIYQFLDDVDIRMRDSSYAISQRNLVEIDLSASNFGE